MIVGDNQSEIELNRGVLLEEVDRLRRGVEVGVDARCVEMRAGLVLKIDSRLVGAVVDAGTAGRRAGGYP